MARKLEAGNSTTSLSVRMSRRMSLLGSLFTQTKSTEADVESQGFELSRNVSVKSGSQASRRDSGSESSPLNLNLAQPAVWKCLSLRATDAVEISVGEGDESRAFWIPKKQLCRHSAYFRESLGDGAACNAALSGEDPRVFGLFHSWVKTQEPPVKYIPNVYSDEPWRSLAAQAWVLGQRLDASQFMQYAFCQFILNCALVDPSTWTFIEAQTEEGSSLRRFSNHWIAWNVSLAQTEYGTLKAASLADQVSDNTRDPRTYHVDHWNLLCGDIIGAACDHNIGAKTIAHPRVTRRYSEKGRDWELGQSNESNASSSNPPPRRPSRSPSRLASPSPLRSPSPRPASAYSSERSTAPRHRRWILAVCTVLALVNLGLSILLLPYGSPDFAIRHDTVAFSIFVAFWAATFCVLHWMQRCCCCSLGLFDALYCIFAFAAAIATAVDASSCHSADLESWYGSTAPCQIIGALSAFNWFSLCAFLALILSRFLSR